jgi:hypothetical protein
MASAGSVLSGREQSKNCSRANEPKSNDMNEPSESQEWTEGKVFAYVESEDYKGLADAINAALAAEREKSATRLSLADDRKEQIIELRQELTAEREKVKALVEALELARDYFPEDTVVAEAIDAALAKIKEEK